MATPCVTRSLGKDRETPRGTDTTSAEDKAGVENRGEHRDRDSGDRFSDRERNNSKEYKGKVRTHFQENTLRRAVTRLPRRGYPKGNTQL